jgi:hypothetical protein
MRKLHQESISCQRASFNQVPINQFASSKERYDEARQVMRDRTNLKATTTLPVRQASQKGDYIEDDWQKRFRSPRLS